MLQRFIPTHWTFQCAPWARALKHFPSMNHVSVILEKEVAHDARTSVVLEYCTRTTVVHIPKPLLPESYFDPGWSIRTETFSINTITINYVACYMTILKIILHQGSGFSLKYFWTGEVSGLGGWKKQCFLCKKSSCRAEIASEEPNSFSNEDERTALMHLLFPTGWYWTGRHPGISFFRTIFGQIPKNWDVSWR